MKLSEYLLADASVSITCPLCHRPDVNIVFAGVRTIPSDEAEADMVLEQHDADVTISIGIRTRIVEVKGVGPQRRYVSVRCPASGQLVKEVKS